MVIAAPSVVLAQGTTAPSAAGAPLDQILVVTVFTTLVYAGVAWIVLRERTGHPTLVGRLAGAAGRLTGTPRWFALPQLLTLAGIVSGVVGLYWDVSYHLAEGRDEGPLANPSHYFIFLGLVAIFAGAALGVGLATDGLPRRTLRLGRGWQSPIGPVVAMAVGMIALLGFPLDDVWHRLFGQDVTEWGPTHVLMIGGTVLSCLGILLACAEVRQVQPGPNRLRTLLASVAVLVFLCGPAAFLLEYAYGIPQFPLVNDSQVLALAASLAFVYAAFHGIRAVLALWVAYLAVQFGLAALNAFVFDALVPWPASLVGGALVGVLVARHARPTLAYGVPAGAAVAVGTVAGDFLWTGAMRPMPWPADLLPVALALGAVVGAAAGAIAVWLRVRMDEVGTPTDAAHPTPTDGRATRRTGLGVPALVGFAVVLGVFAWNVPPRADADVVADLTVLEERDGEARVRITLDPADAASDARWFETLSWQGGGAVAGDLVEVSPGVYESDRFLPVDGRWKTLVRLHTGLHTLVAAPIYLPADEAIPVPEIALDDGPREFVPESEILRREERPDVPQVLWTTAYAVVGALFLGLFAAIAAGVTAAARPGAGRSARPATRRLTGAGR